ncbi:hypothetical protein B296_00018901 [Ensete ventricosum]|uniref:Uncharacterized protein n=1 Tax=Ensete ventricosum TaxID=4639 RepID=A0A427AFA8_ENSVE|nr:hypothetical protein B296_00018901 [Ensete ventricosum]
MQGEEIAHRRRNRPQAMDRTGEEDFGFFFSLFFFLPPSADTTQNRSVTVEIDRYRPTAVGYAKVSLSLIAQHTTLACRDLDTLYGCVLSDPSLVTARA